MKLLFPNLVFAGSSALKRACSGERSIAMSYRYANLPIEQVRPNAKNTRTHSKKQIRQIATSIRELGFAAPVLVDEYDVLIAGHGRLEAARSLGMASIPAIILDGSAKPRREP